MQVKPDFTVPMCDMIAQGISRPIEVFALGADLRWDDSGNLIDASFNDDLSKKHTAQRLRTALQPNNDFTKEMVKRAVDQLSVIRLSEQPNGALIIFVRDSFNADKIAKIVQQEHKITAVTAHVGIQDSGDKIEQFKTSSDQILIACKMVSEGVNIKRARVGLYLTNVTSPLAFEQCITRLSRKERFDQSEPSYFYVPADPRIVNMVNKLENVKLITLSADDTTSASTLGAGGSGSSSIFVPISAAATETTGIFRGEHATEAELKLAAKFRAEHPDLAAGIPDTQLGKIAAAYESPEKVDELEPKVEPIAEETYDEKRSRRKKRASKLANKLAHRKGVEPKEVHRDWLQQGNRRQSEADLSDLDAKITWLEREIEKNPSTAISFFETENTYDFGAQNV